MTVLADAITSSNASDITSSEHVGAVRAVERCADRWGQTKTTYQ